MNCVLIFVFFISLASSFQYPLIQSFPLNATLGPKIFTFQSNLKTTAVFTVVSAEKLVFCFQAQYSLGSSNNTPVLSNNSVNWGLTTCTQFVTTDGNSTSQIFFSQVPFAVGVFFQNATGITTAPIVTISIGAADDSCTAGQVWDFTACVAPTAVAAGEHAAPVGISTYLYTLNKAFITGNFTIACVAGVTDLEFWIQLDGSPVGATKYTCAAPPPVFNNPRNGLFGYYVIVNNTGAAPSNFAISELVCQDYLGGPGCTTQVLNATFIQRLQLITNHIYYFKINATVGNSVWVSTRGVNDTDIYNINNPAIFASLNQLPQVGNADIGGCTQEYCSFVNAIQFNVTTNQTWYIGVQSMNTESFNGSFVGVWFNSLCAPDCPDHGNCKMSGPEAGYCECIDGFIGVDCATPHGFGPQFIVLIIIAVLVALTAVIGFGAWAYMRRKRGQYDIVS